MRRCLFLLILLVAGRVAGQQPNTPAGNLEEIMARTQQAEETVLTNLKALKPLMEVYLQDIKSDASLAITPTGDTYLLGRFEFLRGPRFQPLNGDGSSLERMTATIADGRAVRYVPDGFAAMAAPDWDFRDLRRYTFTLVRREFVGEVRCFVVDVRPTKNPQDGFSGRLWIEDRGYNIVRFNGINRKAERDFFREQVSFHVDGWRTNVLPGLWLPSYVYVEQTNADGLTGDRGTHLRGHVRLWGYDPRMARRSADAIASILSDAPLGQDALPQAQLSPVLSARQWEAEAETNVLDRLARASLIAAPGEAEKVLETVINNLEVTNDIVNDPPLKVRVLLTTPLESFTVGRTIVLSRGLIDVLPDEASLAMMLAHELAHVVLDHPLIDTQFAFGDRLMVGDEELLRLLKVKRTPAEEAAADAKVMQMLDKSPYKDSLAGAGLFLRIVADRTKVLPNLIAPHIGDHVAGGGQILRLAQLMDAAPELNREKLDQVAALSLGARLTLNPWHARLELIRNAAQRPESAREKVPLAVTPLIPYLRYVDAPPLLRP